MASSSSCRKGGSDVKKKPSPEEMDPESDHNDAKNCCICCEEIKVYATGSCDHPICYKCSARMRVLSNQTYCATCRAEMKQVVVTFQERKFADFVLKSMKVKRGAGFYFEEWRLADIFDALFDNVCSECPALEKPLISFEDLKTHLRRAHDKQFCQICLDALTNFPSELKVYTKKELVAHRKDGDSEDKSHRGHPECKFCNDRFVDNDTLLFHLRKGHFWCHFCEHDGKQEYYNVYKDLRMHFGEVHFLCDEGECRHEKFTSVFRDKIDYQAHKLAAHGKNFNKMQAREARKIEFDYSYRKRQPTTVVAGSDYTEVQSSEVKQSRGDVSNPRRANTMDFSNFEDVERERQELKKDKENKEGKTKSPETKKRDSDSNVPAAPSSGRSQCYNDDDIIGFTEHINSADNRVNHRKPDTDNRSNERKYDTDNRANQRKYEEKSKPPVQLKEEKSADTIKPIQDKSKNKINKTEGRNSPKISEDFPLLPGGVPSPNLHTVRKKEVEDFPALGKSVRPKEAPKPTPSNPSGITHVNGIPVTVKKKGKEKGKSWTQQSGRANIALKDDFPSLQTIDLNQNVKEQKTSAKFTNVVESKPNKVPPSNDKRHSASSNSVISNGKGPPGLGLGATGFRQKDSAPPGFVSTPADTMERNLRERNMRLVGLLQTYLDDFNLQIFKNVSGDFRKDQIPASEYYSCISELLGDNLKYVFSELVALLPDEKKRENLLKLHQNAKLAAKQKEESVVIPNIPKRAVWGSGPQSSQPSSVSRDDEETWCADCGQVFSRDQMVKHMESHGEAFPSLPTSKQKKKFMPFKTVHQSQVRNAWTK